MQKETPKNVTNSDGKIPEERLNSDEKKPITAKEFYEKNGEWRDGISTRLAYLRGVTGLIRAIGGTASDGAAIAMEVFSDNMGNLGWLLDDLVQEVEQNFEKLEHKPNVELCYMLDEILACGDKDDIRAVTTALQVLWKDVHQKGCGQG